MDKSLIRQAVFFLENCVLVILIILLYFNLIKIRWNVIRITIDRNTENLLNF